MNARRGVRSGGDAGCCAELGDGVVDDDGHVVDDVERGALEASYELVGDDGDGRQRRGEFVGGVAGEGGEGGQVVALFGEGAPPRLTTGASVEGRAQLADEQHDEAGGDDKSELPAAHVQDHAGGFVQRVVVQRHDKQGEKGQGGGDGDGPGFWFVDDDGGGGGDADHAENVNGLWGPPTVASVTVSTMMSATMAAVRAVADR